jgi:peptide/nickel transport system substrate-binding protein
MEGVTGTIMDRVTSAPDLQLLSAKSGRYLTFVMNCETTPFSNADVRTGLKYLIDRDKYVQVVLKGQGQAGNDQPISPIDPWYCPDIPAHTYDPDKAKFYLKKAGAENASFNLSTSSVTGNLVEAALFYQQMADQAGIKINIVREPPDTYWANVWLKKPFCMVTWNPRPTADMLLSIVYLSTADWNDTHWRRPNFDKLILAARGELDHAKRLQMYCEAERMIHDDGGSIIPGFENIMDAALKKVHGLELSPLGPLGFWQSEAVWLES